MKNSIIIPATAVLGAITGFLLYFYLKFTLDDLGNDWVQMKNYWDIYFFTGGLGYSVISKVMISSIAGGYVLSLLAIVFIAKHRVRQLEGTYQSLDMNTKYIVNQRKKDTLILGLGCLLVAVFVYFIYSKIHSFGPHSYLENRIVSKTAYPKVAFIATSILITFFMAISLICFYAVLTHGHFRRIPLAVRNNEIHFFRLYHGLPIVAIDKPVFASLEDSDIDFKSQGGKGYLVIATETDRVVISPKLDFVEGSYDELMDYLEQFVVVDEEDEI